MTCRHDKDDVTCSSHPRNQEYIERTTPKESRETVTLPTTPDAMNYTVERVQVVTPHVKRTTGDAKQHLVLMVRYPNCARCAYEGNKVMVFLDTAPTDALFWQKIDPHFRKQVKTLTEAPSPAARFPASEDGWKDALAYAATKG